ncbi:hypothetical protein B0H17DRAFT_1149536 [Mycena rosella]|uniref:Enoyl reductase (ER) domain-containing protein n=1 Tax=Mycena rosella TaxID=1033263 RepID=A0AAD7C2N5_MYCRO|nr:hypothetical protein B0H17DRAFT_1149536 [Mycena rosella]
MVLTPNPRVVLAKNPSYELPVAGEHIVYDPSPTIDLDLKLNGGFLTKTLLLSPEPYMRERIRDASIESYSTPMQVGQPLVGFGLVLVLRSEKEGVKAGDYMYGFTPWEAYTVQPYMDARTEYKNFPAYTFDMDSLVLQPVPNPEGAFPWTRYCSCIGAPGLTAFIGLEHLAPDAKAGQTIYVSSGASGVGRLKTIGSASTDAKVEYMRSVGADVAFNYKTTPVAAALAEHGPIDLFFDNVGGEQLEAALENMNFKGRVISCGAIAEYNIPNDQRYGIKNMSIMFKRRIRLEGFIVADTPEYNTRFFTEIPPLVAQGKITGQEQLFAGLERGPEAFLSMFDGKSTAKPVVVVDRIWIMNPTLYYSRIPHNP